MPIVTKSLVGQVALGPVATPPRTALPDGTRAVVLTAIGAAAGGAMVDELSATVGVHANSVRNHVAALVEVGLVDALTVPPAGRGRPAHRYAVSVAGEALLARARADRTSGGDEYRGLAEAFARHLATRPGAQREARAVGELWGAQVMAARPRGRGGVRAALLALLADLGFAPAAASAPDAPESTVTGSTVPESAAPTGPANRRGSTTKDTVLLRACPLLAAATDNPDVICQVHLGLVVGARAALGTTRGEVGLEPFAQPGACRLTLPA
jgi:predicted ArsR family transcriptional regulator